ncbi:MAG: hypothetical protein Q7U08_05095, partial [Flavobacteriaceae bacterium]|nr:hypothetical protein [Flavobacteriaceae bacterium]
MEVYDLFKRKQKQLAVLVDPDKPTDAEVISLAKQAELVGVDYFFVGGSLLTNNNLDACIKLL